MAGVAQTVGDLRLLAVLERIHVDRAQLVRQHFRVYDPLGVGGPFRRHLIAERRIVVIPIHFRDLPGLHVHDADSQHGIAEKDLLVVRRPFRIVEKRVSPEVDFLYFANARLLRDVQLIFTRFIAHVGDLLTIGGPRGHPLGYTRRGGQVPHVALLGGHGEDVASRFEHGAHPGGAECGVADSRPHLLERRPHSGQVPVQSDLHRRHSPGLQVIQFQPAEALQHDRSRPECGAFIIQPRILYRLDYFPGLGLIAE